MSTAHEIFLDSFKTVAHDESCLLLENLTLNYLLWYYYINSWQCIFLVLDFLNSTVTKVKYYIQVLQLSNLELKKKNCFANNSLVYFSFLWWRNQVTWIFYVAFIYTSVLFNVISSLYSNRVSLRISDMTFHVIRWLHCLKDKQKCNIY